MERIIKGILKFREVKRQSVLQRLTSISKMKQPDAVFISCMDARVYPTHFTFSEIGDLHMIRNAGNFVPSGSQFIDETTPISTEPGGIELACCRGSVKNIVICGHSNCKAMNLLMKLGKDSQLKRHEKFASPLEHWVTQQGAKSLETFSTSDPLKIVIDIGQDFPPLEARIDPEQRLSSLDRLSQINVLQQMANVYTHPIILDRIALGNLHILGMWYNISSADVQLFSRIQKRFVVVDEASSSRLLEEYS